MSATTQPAFCAESWSWSAERVEAAVALFKKGFSAAKIATEIGAPTRNTVLGKISRMGLTRADTAPRVRKAMVTPHSVPPRPVPRIAARAPTAKALPEAPVVPVVVGRVEAAIKVGRWITFDELRSGRCRWPIGDTRDDSLRFCGDRVPAEVLDRGRCYCASHIRASSQPGTGRGRGL